MKLLFDRLHQFASALILTAVLPFLFVSGPSWAQTVAGEWSPPVNFSEVPDLTSDSPVLLCDPNQNVHLLWMERDDQNSFIYYRTDASGSWSIHTDILALPLTTYLDAAITPDGFLHVVWVTTVNPILYYTRVPLALAGDVRQWPEPVVLAVNVEHGGNVFAGSGMITSDELGNLYAVYGRPGDSEGLTHTLLFIRSDDGGETWSEPSPILSLSTPEQSDVYASLALDQAGRMHVGWTVRSYEYGAYSSLGYTRSTDGGKTWHSQEEIASANTAPGVAMMGVFAFGDDEVHLTWDEPERLHRWSHDGGETWSAPELIMATGAAFGGYNQLAKDSAGMLHDLSAVGDGVFHVAWGGSSWGAPETIDGRAFDPHGQQLVVCQGNQLHVVYHDRTLEHELWYSTKSLGTPHKARRPIPAPAGQTDALPSTVPLEPEVTPAATRTPVPHTEATVSTSSGQDVPAAGNPAIPLVVAIGLALSFVIASVVIVWSKRHR